VDKILSTTMVLTTKIFMAKEPRDATSIVLPEVKTVSPNFKKQNSKNKTSRRKSRRTKPSAKLSNAQIHRAPVAFNILLNHLLTKFGIKVDQAIKEVITFHDNLIKNHSVVEGTARFNKIRLYSIKLLEGQNPDPLDRVAVGRKDRWPSAFNLLRPLFYRVRDENCRISDRVIRSILYLNRLCEGNNVPDFTEIQKEFSVSDSVRDQYREHLSKVVKVHSGELITKPSTRVLSNGPNSRPKWLTADLEAYALMRSELHEHFKDLCIATGNLDLYEYMKSRSETQTRVDRIRLRYITTVRDSGNKCRLVAISDYWTQVLLEPIMLDVQQYIKQTFGKISYSNDHPAGFRKMRMHIRPGVKSYDVTSWTDAFPATLQYDFMEARYGNRIATAWYNLVVSCKWTAKGQKDPIKYERGQGMGTNGSFDIATATDLLFLEMVYRRDYGKAKLTSDLLAKVGDDLWCHDPLGHVYNAYTKELGIDINMSKTKDATEENLCGEFVSRNINYGHDVSRISANICRAVKKNILDLPQLAYHLQERGYESIIPLKEIFNGLKIRGDHKKNVVRTLYLLCLLHPNQGLQLLKKSMEQEFPREIVKDVVLSTCMVLGVTALKATYEAYSVHLLLNSIQGKLADIVDATTEFDSSDALSANADEDKYWLLREPIGLLTSKVILGRSWRSIQEMYSAPEFDSTSSILQVLENTDQRVTFKELGIISDDSVQWRPKATKLHNLSTKLTANSESLQVEVFNHLANRGKESLYLTVDIQMPDGTPLNIGEDPIFGDTYKKVPHITGR
jgi:hypothetical protein